MGGMARARGPSENGFDYRPDTFGGGDLPQVSGNEIEINY